MDEAESSAKKLEKAIKKLTERYKALAAAIADARRQGTGVGSASGNEPIGTPAGASLQSGGQFVVPSTIPSSFKTPGGGMLAEVHPGELVTVVSAPQVAAPRPVKDRAISGASFKQEISNVTNTSNTANQSFNLNVQEVVSSDIKTSFGLLQSLGGAN
jgi:hypothetical protein